MASLLCALSFASASSLSTKPKPVFTNLGIHLATTRASPTHSCSPRLPVLRASSEGLPAELLEDSKISLLNDDYPKFGPSVDSILNAIKWDKNGLVVAIAQHVNTGAILMQGFANCDAVSATITSGRATFYSRSRSSLWTKGETSSNFINVKDVFLDCDRDSIIYLGLPDGPTCHTGAVTCYFTPASSFSNEDQNTSERSALTTLYSLEETISKRRDALLMGQSVSGSYAKPSWTHKLLKDHSLLCSKIREEADELCRTLENSEGKERAASEMADVLYHSMVLLTVQDVKLEDVIEVLRARFSQSGIEEKNSRTKS